MNLVIISSEPLNPGDLYSSTFELDQAKILSKLYDVSIISVDIKKPLIVQWKALVKHAFSSPSLLALLQVMSLCLSTCTHLLGQRKVNIYNIEGINVYEGEACHLFREISFETLTNNFGIYLKPWILAARAAFCCCQKVYGSAELIHAHGRFLNAGIIALELRRELSIPYIYTEHSSFYERELAPLASRTLLEQVIDAASAFTTVSVPLLESVENFLHKKIRDPKFLNNTLDSRFELKAPIIPDKKVPFSYLSVASLDHNKRVDIILHAFAESYGGNETYKLTICGDGPLRDALTVLTRELAIEKQVIFLGKVSKAEILTQVDKANVFVSASEAETFGVAIIEALSRGRPVIATRCGGPEKTVTSENGILIDCGSVLQMTAALQEISVNYSKYDLLTIREKTIRLYGSDAFISSVRPLYAKALKGVC